MKKTTLTQSYRFLSSTPTEGIQEFQKAEGETWAGNELTVCLPSIETVHALGSRTFLLGRLLSTLWWTVFFKFSNAWHITFKVYDVFMRCIFILWPSCHCGHSHHLSRIMWLAFLFYVVRITESESLSKFKGYDTVLRSIFSKLCFTSFHAVVQSLSCVPLFATPTDYRPLCPQDSPGKSTGVSCHFLLQGIFLTQGSNPCLLCLLHWQVGSLPLVPLGKLPKVKNKF